MSVKPQEEWTEEIFEDMFVEKLLPPTLEQRVGKLEKYEKEELIHRDIVRYCLGMLDINQEIKMMCNMFAQKIMEMCDKQWMSNARIACLEKSDKKLRADLHRAASLNSPLPTHVPNNHKGLFDPAWLDSKLGEILKTLESILQF
jgi:hypothetical protein